MLETAEVESAAVAVRLRGLIARLADPRAVPTGASPEDSARLRATLRACVLRPLLDAIGPDREDDGAAASEASSAPPPPDADEPAPGSIDEELWRLALDITRLARQEGVPAAIGEAVAAVQRLACAGTLDGGDLDAARCRALRAAQGDDRGVTVVANGPYVLTNVDIVDCLGSAVGTTPVAALCRCGGSSTKPWCDGSHTTNGFSDLKDAKRVPDRLDTHAGRDLVVTDNRGTCAHAGFCTDRVATAFRAAREPFVAPNGARLDEVARAVRACPSGALGLQLFGDPGLTPADQDREPVVEISRDGPYRVRGGVPLTDAQGNHVPRNQGASAEHYSLCRCGHSLNKPFCSGMHWYVDFKDPPMPPEPTIFEWAGGLPALSRLTRIAFEKHVPADPLLAPLFAAMPSDLPERVAAWLAEVFGGPQLYSTQFGDHAHMLSRHAGAGITEEQRSRWVAILTRCADEAGLPADAAFRSAFAAYLEWGSRMVLATSAEG